MKTYKNVEPTKVNQVLIRAQAIISNGFTKDQFARDKNSKPVPARSDKACSFCMLGAIDRAAFELGYDHKAKQAAEVRLGKVFSDYVWGSTIPTANDNKNTKKENVYDAFTLAILGAP